MAAGAGYRGDMTNAQLYTLLVPALLAVFGVFFGSWTTNKRLDDFRADMKEGFARVDRRFEQIELTLHAVRQDIADTKGTLRAHDEAIGTLKERVK